MEPICLFLCGDVMTGRGIDQILPHPVDPALYEPYVRDACEYVQFAETVNGRIPRPVDFNYIWGDALGELNRAGANARIVNLETAITCATEPCLKGINYRMSPQNIGCITAAGIDCCCLANNHILDWTDRGLIETLETLDGACVSHTGAGHNIREAAAPALLDLAGQGRILIFAVGSTTSGIPADWAAAEDRPGIHLVEDLSENTASRLARAMTSSRKPGDVIVVSIHWGGNWGYEIPDEHINFAHRLIDEGVDLVHGHSSHHVKALEVYQERLILYGCGDFLTDYEGITGYEKFRGDLALMYFARLEPGVGRLVGLRMVPLQSKRFQLHCVSATEARWLMDLLNDLGADFKTRALLQEDHSFLLDW
ncbi:MAG: CapA family protein [Acidobacteria bacterium]|nr:CapA family protein [Acidobacteriota bacterium]